MSPFQGQHKFFQHSDNRQVIGIIIYNHNKQPIGVDLQNPSQLVKQAKKQARKQASSFLKIHLSRFHIVCRGVPTPPTLI